MTSITTVSLKLTESVGLFLREHREKRGLKQKEICESAGISISMLSQIERGVTSPSIDTLGHICHSMNLSISEVFASIEEKSEVTISKRENRLVHKENGIVYEEIIHYVTPKIARQFYILTLDPSSNVTIAAPHKIGEDIQMGVILTGSATVTVDGEEYDVNPGDVISFRPKLEHSIRNKSRASFTLPKKCILLWTANPPRVDKMIFERGDS